MLRSGTSALARHSGENRCGNTCGSFPSMQALKDFWYSDAYQAAKKHRDGQLDVNFIVAIEAQ